LTLTAGSVSGEDRPAIEIKRLNSPEFPLLNRLSNKDLHPVFPRTRHPGHNEMEVRHADELLTEEIRLLR
jgi:hypothetical protein